LVEDWVQGEFKQQILILFYEEDYTQEQVAVALNTSVSTVKRYCMKYGIPIFRMMRDDEL
jgi:DNA-directed RNA polymerase specialized sigma subunit